MVELHLDRFTDPDGRHSSRYPRVMSTNGSYIYVPRMDRTIFLIIEFSYPDGYDA